MTVPPLQIELNMQPSQATSTNRDSVPFPHLLKASEGLDILELSGEKVLLGEDRPEETDAALGYAQDDLVVRDVLRRPLLLGDLEVDRDPCAGRTSSTSGNIIFPTRQTEAQLARGSSPDIKPAVPQAEITPNQAGFGRLATTPALEAPTPYGAQRGPLAMNTAGGGAEPCSRMRSGPREVRGKPIPPPRPRFHARPGPAALPRSHRAHHTPASPRTRMPPLPTPAPAPRAAASRPPAGMGPPGREGTVRSPAPATPGARASGRPPGGGIGRRGGGIRGGSGGRSGRRGGARRGTGGAARVGGRGPQ